MSSSVVMATSPRPLSRPTMDLPRQLHVEAERQPSVLAILGDSVSPLKQGRDLHKHEPRTVDRRWPKLVAACHLADYLRTAGMSGDDLGEQRERIDVARPYDSEVPMIEGGYFIDSEAFSECDHGGIGGAERKVVVLTHQLRHSHEVFWQQVDELEAASGDGFEELRLDLRVDPRSQHVTDLGDDCLRDQESAFSKPQSVEHLRTGVVIGIVGRRGSDERT